MASSQAEPKLKAESSLRLLRNPLKLQRDKEPIVHAQGHVFDSSLECGHCGKTWYEQRVDPSHCGDLAEAEAQSPRESEPVGGD